MPAVSFIKTYLLVVIYNVSWSRHETITKPAKYSFQCSLCLIERPGMFSINGTPFGCSVKLSWEPPSSKGCPITRYTIHFRESAASINGNMTWQTKNMNAENIYKELYHLWLECSQEYDVMVLGWSERGHSVFHDNSMVTVSTEKGKCLLLS